MYLWSGAVRCWSANLLVAINFAQSAWNYCWFKPQSDTNCCRWCRKLTLIFGINMVKIDAVGKIEKKSGRETIVLRWCFDDEFMVDFMLLYINNYVIQCLPVWYKWNSKAKRFEFNVFDWIGKAFFFLFWHLNWNYYQFNLCKNTNHFSKKKKKRLLRTDGIQSACCQ